MRIVYGKSALLPEEINWLNGLTYIRTSFCKNLHAKCYLNEELCIVTSLNLYEFSKVNNNEMGVLLRRSEQPYIFYLHPWEVDPQQPRVEGISAKSRFRHYLNLNKVEGRLNNLLADFEWSSMKTIYGY